MSLRQPLQLLSLSPSGKLLATACGNKIQIVDVESNSIIAASDESNSHASKCMVRHLVWHTDSKLVSNAEDKHVKEWRIQYASESEPAQMILEQQRELPKRANAISITEDGQTLVIADKFGDVYAFPMFGCSPSLPSPPAAAIKSQPATTTVTTKEDTPISAADTPKEGTPDQATADEQREIKPFKGGKIRKVGNTHGVAPEWRHVPAKIAAITPVVGHVSMLTAMLVLQNQGKIITADRDEHIRVSKWPQGWEIEHFLLGQRKFVSALALHPLDSNILISAGGDDTLRMWDLTTYKCIRKDISAKPLIGTAEVRVHIPVTAPGRRPRKWVKKMVEDEKIATQPEEAEAQKEPEAKEPSIALPAYPEGFVPKIKKLDLGITQMVSLAASEINGDVHVVVSSVGSSALLAWPAQALLDTSAEPPHQFLDMGSPILSITANPVSQTLFVSLDVSNAPEKPAVQAFRVFGQQLVQSEHPVLPVLREQCTAAVTDDLPYPTVQSLYPETALLSKDPKDHSGWNLDKNGAADEEDVEPEAEDAE